MKKIAKVVSVIVLLIFLLVALNFPRSKFYESYVRGEIDKKNYCSTKEDCISVMGKCPFECYIYVNKAESEKINRLVNSYKSGCIYDCMYCPNVECIKNKCEPICPQKEG